MLFFRILRISQAQAVARFSCPNPETKRAAYQQRYGLDCPSNLDEFSPSTTLIRRSSSGSMLRLMYDSSSISIRWCSERGWRARPNVATKLDAPGVLQRHQGKSSQISRSSIKRKTFAARCLHGSCGRVFRVSDRPCPKPGRLKVTKRSPASVNKRLDKT